MYSAKTQVAGETNLTVDAFQRWNVQQSEQLLMNGD